MKKEGKEIFKKVLEIISLDKIYYKDVERIVNNFKKEVEKEIKKLKIDSEVFKGGSFAKGTLIKKDIYDVDIFIRFDKKYRGQNISDLTEKILKKWKKVSKVHGSRDYFRIKKLENFFIEIIPVMKINSGKPQEAENVTDLSYSHVRYINKKIINSSKLKDEIKIAKAFCHFSKTYGAESYIKGFSGYSLELLILYYKGFLNFIKAIAKHKIKSGKIIIDIEKHYKRKENILLDINSSKLTSPIIIIDPTYKQRNALAALSYETFEMFQKECKKFLRNPSLKFFEERKTDLEKIKKKAILNKKEFIILEAETIKQEGDIAGTKLLKFYNYFANELSRFFNITKKDFRYNGEKKAQYLFVLNSKKREILEGPFLKDEENTESFKQKHKKTFKKENRIYAEEKINFNANDFVKSWIDKNQRQIRDMGVSALRIVIKRPERHKAKHS